MTKITPEHLGRGAFVYVRQSTADQVLDNHEVGGVSMLSLIERGLWGGTRSK